MYRLTTDGLQISLLPLAACSDKRSEADIRQAYEAVVTRANEQMICMGSEQAANPIGETALLDVSKPGCKEVGESSGYNGDVQVDISVPLPGRQPQWSSRARMTGWSRRASETFLHAV